MIEEKDIMKVGKFQKTHALKGELNAILDIDPVFFTSGNAMIVEIDGIFVPFFISNIRKKGNTSFLIHIQGLESEDEARQLVNKAIYAEKSKLASFLDMDEQELLEEDDFVGYKIMDASNQSEIGIVKYLETSTQNVLFIVENSEGNEIYIPAVEDFIKSIDDEHKVIEMLIPDGLIDINNSK